MSMHALCSLVPRMSGLINLGAGWPGHHCMRMCRIVCKVVWYSTQLQVSVWSTNNFMQVQ